jgi:hypothetical protein
MLLTQTILCSPITVHVENSTLLESKFNYTLPLSETNFVPWVLSIGRVINGKGIVLRLSSKSM